MIRRPLYSWVEVILAYVCLATAIFIILTTGGWWIVLAALLCLVGLVCVS